jgi:hypothetical protein
MSAAKLLPITPRRRRQRGVAAVEFAICGVIFFMLVFGIIELARAMYICNTLQEVTRRAAALAANTDFSNTEAMRQVRERAIFRESPGQLLLADPISDRHIKIDFLTIPLNSTTPAEFSGSLPASPEQNRENCMADPNGAQCIRLVRARVCLPESNDCDAVPYKTLVSFVPMPFGLPLSTTVVTAETLGLPPRVPPT